jgi:GntR family transcriptional regulator
MSTSHSDSRINGTAGFAAIAEVLRNEVLRGRVRPGEQLPAISELAQRYGTTPITVRRALRELEEQGLCRVEHGVGTFVADWTRPYDLLHVPSFSEALGDREPETRVVSREATHRRAEAAAALGLEPHAPLAVLGRLRLLDDVALVVQRSYMHASLAELVDAYEPNASLYQLLHQRTGRVPAAAEETLEPVSLEGAIAALMDVQPVSLGWRARRTTFDSAGEPLVYDDAFFPAARMRVRLVRRGSQSTVGFEPVPTPAKL